MIVVLIAKERIYTTSLPEKVSGRYWICDTDEAGRNRQLIDIEGIQDQWILHSSSFLALLDDAGQEVDHLLLGKESRVINCRYRKDGKRIQLYIDAESESSQTYRKYCVQGNCRLDIGRAPDNQIVYENKYVSSKHACLIWKDQKWSVTDTQSSNGTFVNERRIATKPLIPGDVIYIMGLKIVVGNGFFAVNHPNGGVSLATTAVAEMEPQQEEGGGEYSEEHKNSCFYRSPRFFRGIVKKSIQIDQPPPIQEVDETPLALLLGPALTMGMTAVVMGAVAFYNLSIGDSELISTLPTIVMSFSMLCGTLLWPLLTKRSEKKKQATIERQRQAKYREYLDQVQGELFRMCEEQKAVLLENHPSASDCESRVLQCKPELWERSIGQEGFLQLRLGLADLPLIADVKFPERHFSMKDDALQNDVQRLANTPLILKDAPVVCSLIENPVLGVVGEANVAANFLQNLVLQIIALHSYEDVKLIFLVDEAQQAEWGFARLLPHTWSENADLRYFAVNTSDAKALSLALEHIIMERTGEGVRQDQVFRPYYVVIAASVEMAEREGLFAKIQACPKTAGISCVAMASQLTALPKECSAVVELDDNQSALYGRNDQNGHKITFRAEGVAPHDMRRTAVTLANLMMGSNSERFRLPSVLTFLELYGVGKTEHLNVLTRWKENSPVNSLAVPIGLREDGTSFFLDLHEKAHGPHGLVAGMTGSGKSEFIITFILSMALNFHPDEVAFILIDYKGGGLAGAFEDTTSGLKLPHLAGTITNLDGSAVNRALISIQSELRRRQAVFNEAKQVSGEGTIDIYKYQKMFRSGLVSEPVPHLFIVSDEFAELKAQQPEFMAQLISAARIGRSLGVHLILATQKPSGVVDDQIWSNSRFRVCLKVQERADSMDMLKRPDAAELKETGRFYLQVGFNELFELGQSAWCGAPYTPSDRVERKRNESVEVIDSLGRVLLELKKKDSGSKAGTVTQVVSIVQYLAKLAQEEQISTRQLWLPQIPAYIYLDDLAEKYGWSADPYELNPIIGEYDDPFNQSQSLLTIPFTREGNALIYGATGSGKNTLLNTVIAGLIKHYSADQLNLYILDLGEETLRVFADAPQVGDVLLSTDEEKILNLFKMLQEEINRRKKLFVDGDGSYTSYCAGGKNTVPQILVVIRNYAAFSEQFELLDEKLIQIARECNKYGIYLLMTSNAANGIRYRVAQSFANVYALQLNDTGDYIGLFGGTGGVYPSKIKGRGIFKSTQVYEFQTAYFAADASQQSIRAYVSGLSNQSSVRARPVPVLPERVTAEFFQEDFTAECVPLGVEKASLKTASWNVQQSVISLVLTQDLAEMGQTVQGISEQMARISSSVTVLDGGKLLRESPDMAYRYISNTFGGCVETMFNEMVYRNNSYKKAVSAGLPTERYEPEYYIITGFQAILDTLTDDGKDKLNTLLVKAELEYEVRFILCDSVKAMSGLKGAAWFQRHLTGTEGIWVGDGIADQYLMKIGKITNALYSEVPAHFGYLVKRSKPVLVKLVVGSRIEEGQA